MVPTGYLCIIVFCLFLSSGQQVCDQVAYKFPLGHLSKGHRLLDDTRAQSLEEAASFVWELPFFRLFLGGTAARLEFALRSVGLGLLLLGADIT